MAFNSPPPIDPDRGKATQVVADEHRRDRVSGFQDVAIVLGWLRRALIWPVRLALRAVGPHGDHNDTFENGDRP